jgi:hypothetical protein
VTIFFTLEEVRKFAVFALKTYFRKNLAVTLLFGVADFADGGKRD